MRTILSLVLVLMTYSSIQAQTVRTFVLDNLEGETIAYEDLKGAQITVIDFWASWCKPCMKGMPKLEKIYQQYKNQGVNVISVNTDGPRSISKVLPLSRALELSYPIVSDINNDVMQDMEVTQLPTLLIVNKNDEVVYRHEGFSDGDELEIEEEIVKNLK